MISISLDLAGQPVFLEKKKKKMEVEDQQPRSGGR